MNKDPEINELSIFLNELHEESDRGIALLSASIIEDWLSTILKSFLIDNEASKKMLDGFNAPIGTFSAKINMAFSLGLIMKNEYKEIEIDGSPLGTIGGGVLGGVIGHQVGKK
ncbi:hypothetical protein ACSNKO_00180 [Proteus mirabilis]|uniref:hypothetical protein n=1 Tax=Proteus mirabilis TaxID=584 RepID=UPI003F1D0464